ncbi:hypothetical protein QE152_g24485 [Popillia japonica]|uniref:Uncharacterized protein n=1 Tax=Popillia japonica TaxID=7064 RepID=A0AAW1KAY5_POPJA
MRIEISRYLQTPRKVTYRARRNRREVVKNHRSTTQNGFTQPKYRRCAVRDSIKNHRSTTQNGFTQPKYRRCAVRDSIRKQKRNGLERNGDAYHGIVMRLTCERNGDAYHGIVMRLTCV